MLHGAHIIHNLANIAWRIGVEQLCFRSENNSDSQCGSVTLPQNRSLFPRTRSRSSPLHAFCADRAYVVRINLHEQTRGISVWRTTRGLYQSVLDLYFEVLEKPLTA